MTSHHLSNRNARRQLLSRGLILGGGAMLPLAPVLLQPALAQTRSIESRLAALGIELPEPPAAVANYLPYQAANGFAYIAGQIPRRDGELLYPGSIPDQVSPEQGTEAARQCAINILAALESACEGDWSRVRQCMRLDGFVASAPGFNGQSGVINGASDLMVEVFAEAGKHTRTAVGVIELPLDACVEVSAVFAID